MIGNPGTPSSVEGVAIIGMAGRFPGSRNTQEFWKNLKAGVESISFFSDEELAASGVDVASVKDNPNYVRTAGIVPDVDLFDAAFFGISPREAELMDPQQRLLLECAWEALENAGFDGESYQGSIGVYAGMNKTSYLLSNLYPNGNTISALAPNQTELANERDYLTTRISYKLNLKGPSVSVQTACSTSLVAIVMAYQSLLNYQCDMALAGGVCVRVPQKQGYWYEETGVASPDGHCRPFDEQAQGTVPGSGVGVVVLKRLEDAILAGDSIYAVIKGAAINNDGAAKLSYTAPSVDGQAEVIAMAQAVAFVDPATISYIECHGTGTPLGDPIEISALTQAFRAGTEAKAFCAIGAVKSNIGHLDSAAGVAGFIKTVLALHHKLLPPSLHYENPNPKCKFEETPFYVNAKLTEWEAHHAPRRAGVSAFGFGGTNAHIILEEAPPLELSGESRPWQLLRLSAKTETALEAATCNLSRYFKDNPQCNLADAAYTLSVGRRSFDHRRTLVCRDVDDAVTALEALDRRQVTTQSQERRDAPVVFMFPGQGSQYVNMGREIYHTEPVFREELDRCAALLEPHLGCGLLQLLYPAEGQVEEATERLTHTALAQPAIFAIEYALAKLWMEWGIRPQKMIGHSVGEFVAACLAGVFSLKDALALIAARGRFIQTLPAGAMLAVPLSEKEVAQFLGKELALAAVNGLSSCVISGPREAVDALDRQLAHRHNPGRHLHTSHAFHSAMMDPILGTFEEEVRKIRLHSPSIPFISSVTGTWITPEEATQPSYWVNHLRKTVRFSEGLSVLLEEPHRVLLEVGPGQTLSTFAKRHPALGVEHTVLPTLRHVQEETSDVAFLLNSLGRLWLAGVKVDWSKFYAGERRHRIPLPTYPFERKRFWIDPPLTGKQHTMVSKTSEESLNREVAVSEPHDPPPWRSEDLRPALQLSIVPAPATSRKERILAELINIIHNLSGVEIADLDVNATFLELGFDSLFLTQANTEFRKKFDVKITFRQLLNEAPTLEALAQFINSNLRPEAFLEESPQLALVAAPPPIGLSPHPTGMEPSSASSQRLAQDMAQLTKAAAQARESVSNLERMIHQKLQAMSQSASSTNGASAAMPPTSAATRSKNSVEVGRVIDERVSEAGRPAAADVTGVPTGPQSAESKPQRFGPWKPIDHSPVEGLDSRRQRHLNDLISRYTARTWKSRQLTETHRPHFADPRAVAGFRTAWKEMVYPIVAVRSSGSKLWDIDGNEYVDITLGFGSNLFGHSPEFVTRALEEQIRKGIEIGPQSPLAGEVARSLCELTGMERASFCNTGSEAVLAALRVARTATGRNKIALFAGAYHGIFDEVLVKSTTTGSGRCPIPIAPGIPQHMVKDVLVLEYGDPKSQDILEEHAADLAAVLVEPVQSRRPDLQPKEFLLMLREWTEKSGVVLIFDEVITGFRLHPGGAQAWFNVQADLATYGKVVGGGMPIGILGGKAALMDALDGGMWNYGDSSFPEVGVTYFAGTFVRHPLAMASASSVLNHLKKAGPELQQRLNDKAARFAMDLNDYFKGVRAPIHIPHCGSIFHLDFLEQHKFSSLLFFHLREKGVHIWEGRPFFISTAHTDEDLTFVAQAIRESVIEMQDAGFLTGSPSDPSRGVKRAPHDISVSSNHVRPAGTLPAHTRRRAHSGTTELPSKGSHTQEFPLTESQTEIWLATRLGEDASRAFNECFTVRLKGKLDLKAMCEAVQQMVARHDALRATVNADGDYQRIAPSVSVELPFTDLSTLDQKSREAQLASLLRDELCQSFELAKGPLLRLRIFKLGEEDHLLQLVAHHIVCDGWSFGVLLEDLAVLYSAACEGTDAELTEPMQFREYAAWQQEQRHSTDGAAVEAYWLGQFSGGVPVLDLPADRSRPPIKTYNCRQQQIAIGKACLTKLKQISLQKEATFFATLLAAYNILLHRLSAQEDLIVGLALAGQLSAGSTNLVGHCVNLLPLRTQISGHQRFSEYLAGIKNLLVDAADFQNCTFGSLVNKLNLPRDPGRLPLISTIITYETATPGLNFADLNVEVAGNPKSFCNFDLELYLMESDAGLAVNFRYNTDLFDDDTIRRWVGHYHTLLEGIVADPDRLISEMPLLNEAERHQILVEWNNTRVDYPGDLCLHQLFEAQVERTPDTVAAVYQGSHLTYRDLNARANQLAHYLQRLGVAPDVLVGMAMERSLEMVIGLLGILKAGGAYAPLDPAYPRERLAFILEDAQAQVLLTQQKLVEDLPAHGTVVPLDKDWDVIARESKQRPISGATAQNLAYIIYTSGSTGKPKGVAIEHRNTVAFLNWARTVFAPEQLAGVLASTSICFDLSVFELFVPVSWGGQIILAQNVLQLPALPANNDVTLINTVPSALAELLRMGGVPASLRTVNLAGEPLQTPLVKQIYEQGRVEQVFDLYGPSEDTTYSTFALRSRSGPASIGRPIANTQIYLLDAHLQPVPLGVAGEVYIGGAGLARGYLKRPDLTAEKFIPNPFSPEPGARLYETGDLARYRPDGNIEFLGRIDHQVKLRGFRIELGEIETVLGQHPGVRETVVVAREDKISDKRLVAYVVPNQELVPTLSELRQFVEEKLPSYMVPSAFVLLDALPLTPNGKMDRRALPAPDQARPKLDRAFVAPRTPAEEVLVGIWSEVLGFKQIGIHDNFFELGGNSLLGTRVMSRLRHALQVELPLHCLFKAPTVAGLAVAIAPSQAQKAEEIARQLAELELLSDEESQRVLAIEKKQKE